MSYFNELPNLEVVSRFPNQSNNQDYTTIKNLWRRAKLREDIANVITAFNYYQIKEGERPDQIAEKVYGDPELDWVILITNNITNVNDEWPLDNESFYNYLIDKYGSEPAIEDIHHVETIEQKDKFNRLVFPGGLQVDSQITNPSAFNTNSTDNDYQLDVFPFINDDTTVTVNLVQVLNIKHRTEGDILYSITDIQYETSNMKVYTRNNNILDVKINNDIANTWPSSWGGLLTVYGEGENKSIKVEDTLSDVTTTIPRRLYEVVGELINGEIVPIFRFVYNPTN